MRVHGVHKSRVRKSVMPTGGFPELRKPPCVGPEFMNFSLTFQFHYSLFTTVLCQRILQLTHFKEIYNSVIGERERGRAGASQLNRTTGTIFLVYIYIYIYIYIYHRRCHTANRLRVSKLTQLTIFHSSSPRVYRHIHSSRRCTVATVQDEANPSSSQPAASCCVASESTEAHRDGWRQYVLAEESVLPRKQPKRMRGV